MTDCTCVPCPVRATVTELSQYLSSHATTSTSNDPLATGSTQSPPLEPPKRGGHTLTRVILSHAEMPPRSTSDPASNSSSSISTSSSSSSSSPQPSEPKRVLHPEDEYLILFAGTTFDPSFLNDIWAFHVRKLISISLGSFAYITSSFFITTIIYI